MWTYQQSTGALPLAGKVTARGYSGADLDKNNPATEVARPLHDRELDAYVMMASTIACSANMKPAVAPTIPVS